MVLHERIEKPARLLEWIVNRLQPLTQQLEHFRNDFDKLPALLDTRRNVKTPEQVVQHLAVNGRH